MDYTDYLDSSVMYKLPAGIADHQQIAVIITLDGQDQLAAYEQADTAMSFGQFVNQSAEAAAIRERIAAEKAQVLAQLDAAGVNYTLGRDYATLLSGFSASPALADM